MASYLATNYRIGDGITTVWNVSFAGARPDQGDGTEAYLDPASVKAVLITVNEDGSESTTPVSGSLIGASQFEIKPAVAAGQRIKIYRTTERGYPLVDFTDFATITENDLDIQARQTLYVVQELSDTVAYSDERSVEARAIAAAASTLATKASEDAVAATQASTTASAVASTARTTANSASATATQASQDANNATAAANAATETANTAKQTADSASTVAASASTKATTATTTANAASTASGQAVTASNQAKTLAQTASDLANQAVLTANAAQQTAGAANTAAQEASAVADDVQNFRGELDDLSVRVEELVGADVSSFLRGPNNLSELTDVSAARTNLDVNSKAEVTGLLNPITTRIDATETDISAIKATKVTAGTGLTGGGDLSADRTLSVDGTVVRTSRAVTVGSGLTGGGDLSTDRSISLGTPGTITGATSNQVSGEGHTHSVSATRARDTSSNTQLLLAGAMTDHVGSGDHDTRYYTKSESDQRAEVVGQYVRTPPARLCYFQVPKYNAQYINSSINTKITFANSTSPGRSGNWYYPDAYYDRSTHEFVAPVAGVYFFYAHIMRRGGNESNTAVDIRFAKNGIALVNNAPQGFAPGTGDLAGVSTYLTATIEITTELAAGDRIAVVIRPCDTTIHANASTDSVPTYWGGRLL